MPPKKLKDLSSAPVYGMPHDRQVRLLSDALLREYMHRRGFLATLRAFDDENPRDAETVSSRALMSDLMALDSAEQQRLKGLGIETIMEMLCDIRVEKRLAVEDLVARASAADNNDSGNDDEDDDDDDASSGNGSDTAADGAAPSAEEIAALRADIERCRRQQQVQQEQQQQQLQRRSEKKKAAKTKKSKRKQSNDNSDSGSSGGSDAAADDSDSGAEEASKHRRKDRRAKGEQKRAKGEHKRGSSKTKKRGSKAQPTGEPSADGEALLDDLLGSSGSSNDASNSDCDDDDGGDRTAKGGDHRKPSPAAAAPAAPAWLTQDNNTTSSSGKEKAAPKDSADDDEDGDSGGDDDGDSDDANAVPLYSEGSSPLPAADAAAACRVLYGGGSVLIVPPPVSFLQQGFSFDDNGGSSNSHAAAAASSSTTAYALAQWRRGPGAVIAAVQSLVIAAFFERESYAQLLTRQRECLRKALATIIARAQPDPRRVVIANGRLNASKPRRGFSRCMLSASNSNKKSNTKDSTGDDGEEEVESEAHYFYVWSDFDSTADIDRLVAELTSDGEGDWLAPKGCGLWCFLLSVCLSRGVDAVRKDLGTTTTTSSSSSSSLPTLIDPATGDGTPALLHLMMTGHATPALAARGGGLVPSGFLDGDRVSKSSSNSSSSHHDHGIPPSPSSSTALSNPSFPSWVVHHAGHYSNLFMKRDARAQFRQKKELSGAASAEVFYWDPLTEDDEFTLSVEVLSAYASSGGDGSSASSSSLKRKKSSGPTASFVNAAVQGVPDWGAALVDWGDETPVR